MFTFHHLQVFSLIKSLIYPENFGAKTQETSKLIRMTKSSCCFKGCLPNCKNQHHTSTQSCLVVDSILGILACPVVPGHIHMNGLK